MNLFKREMKKERKLLGFKSPQKVVKIVDHQNGKTNIPRDKKRKALPSGKRISKTGKVYFEYRKNRSDLRGNI